MQCSNHFKQIGLAVHNFHDTRQGLPPSSLGQHRTTIFAMLYPQIEQASLFDRLTAQKIGYKFSGTWFLTLTPEEQKGFGSVPIYYCPSRRGGSSNYVKDTVNDDNQYNSGPQTDYAVVCLGYGYAFWEQEVSGTNVPIDAARVSNNYGPFRIAVRARDSSTTVALTDDMVSAWECRDTMARWQDGTSNQLLFGEKHIPPSRLDKCAKSYIASGDCSYLVSGEGYASAPWMRSFASSNWNTEFTSGTIWSLCRPSDYDNTTTTPMNGYSFGSYHPGICMFVIGDGSVRSISITTPVFKTLISLSHVSDGNSISLP
jgi:hypothetical protein